MTWFCLGVRKRDEAVNGILRNKIRPVNPKVNMKRKSMDAEVKPLLSQVDGQLITSSRLEFLPPLPFKIGVVKQAVNKGGSLVLLIFAIL